MTILTLALAFAASAPSFDCLKASTTAEKIICADEQLAHLDTAMAAGFAALPKQEREQQRSWLKERDSCGTRACLLKAYEGRFTEAFLNRTPKTRHYHSQPNDGDLDILALGDDWYIFSVAGVWPTPGGSVNVAEAIGSFWLDARGSGSRPPTDTGDCGWKFQQLPGDRWRISTLPPKGGDASDCYGFNATIDGVYSRRQRKPK